MPAYAEMLVSQSPPVYSHTLGDYSSATNGPGGYFGNSPAARTYCRTASVQLTPQPLRRQSTPPCLFPPGKGPLSPRRSCLVVRPEDTPVTPEEERIPFDFHGSRNKKKVVFADDQGGQLTQVRVMREPSYMPPIWSLQFLAHVTQGMISPVPQEQWVVDFVQPASDYVRFRQKLDEHNVSLENVIIKETEQMIVGTVKVKNLSYSKEVIIRSSCDGWKTHEDTYCTYSVVGNGGVSAYVIFDTFSFKLTLPPKSRRIEFCACFKCDGVEHWDNNDGRNYSLTNRIAPREDASVYLTSPSSYSPTGTTGSSNNSASGDNTTYNSHTNSLTSSASSFPSPFVDPNVALDTWSNMTVENQSGPYCVRNVTAQRRVPSEAIDGSKQCHLADTRCQTSLHHAVGDFPETPIGKEATTAANNRGARNHQQHLHHVERTASGSNLFYIRERNDGEDLLANLLRLRKLMLSQNAHL